MARKTIRTGRVFSIGALTLGMIGWAVLARAQPVVTGTERLASDRPEAWATQYFTSLILLDGLTPPTPRDAGSLLIGGEIVWVPSLSVDQRRVGFNGTKVEDLNKAPFVARPRVTLGLPGAFAALVAFMPPIETFGIKPKLIAVALERPIYESTGWTTGWRAYGQLGTAKAAFTCPKEVLAFAPGTPENPVGCLDTSADVATLRYIGLELSVGQPTAGRALAPHGAVAINYLNNEFEINARRFDFLDGGGRVQFIDRTVQRSHATRVSLTGGVGFRLGDRLEAAVDVFYTPLWVKRRMGLPRQNDGLATAKVLLSYKLR